MQKKTILKRLLLLFLVSSLVMAFVPQVVMAQEADLQAQEVEEEEAGEAEGASPLEALGINAGLFITQLVNFLIIAYILTNLLWGPAVNMLDSRSEKIKKGLEDAAAAAKARQNAEAEAEKLMNEARAERARLIEDARAQGEEVSKTMQAEARQNVEKMMEDARADAKAARDAELAGLREQVINIAVALSNRVIDENMTANKQSKLASDFFSSVPDNAKKLSGAVEIVSAMPLSDDEKAQAEKTISAESYTYTVDPAILGGLIVRSSDRVVDGSVRTRLSDMADRLS